MRRRAATCRLLGAQAALFLQAGGGNNACADGMGGRLSC